LENLIEQTHNFRFYYININANFHFSNVNINDAPRDLFENKLGRLVNTLLRTRGQPVYFYRPSVNDLISASSDGQKIYENTHTHTHTSA